MNRAVTQKLACLAAIAGMASPGANGADAAEQSTNAPAPSVVPAPQAIKDASDLSLEQLVNVQVTSVSKKETTLEQSPAAISVVTQDDIRRMGVTSIPEALRMVPGLDVAQINSSQWAVTSRGFNSQYANKMLVLIDGRSTYNPGFGGTLWEMQDVMMEDLDRIEVIRGPGATLWGANAVNGVINIITRSASETQGALVSTTVGTEQQPITSVRYGGQITTNLFYRAYVKYTSQTGFSDTSGAETPDAWQATRGGGRMDWMPAGGNHVTLQGDWFASEIGNYDLEPIYTPPFGTNVVTRNYLNGNNILGRWTHGFSETSEFTLQAYYDHSGDREGEIRSIQDIYDVDFQHRFEPGWRQAFVWGLEYRYYPDDAAPNNQENFNPEKSYDAIYSAFLQDDITIVDGKLKATVGAKFQHASDVGGGYEPSLRLLWTPTPKQTVWGSISRALRIPTRFDTDAQYTLSVSQPPPSPVPVEARTIGNPQFTTEKLIAYEAGYRVMPAREWSFDIAGFYNHYYNLQSATMGAPFFDLSPAPHEVIPFTIENGPPANIFGTEISVQWKPVDDLTLAASYSWLHEDLHPNSSVADQPGLDPENKAQLRAYWNITKKWEANTGVYYVDKLRGEGIPAYFRVDLARLSGFGRLKFASGWKSRLALSRSSLQRGKRREVLGG